MGLKRKRVQNTPPKDFVKSSSRVGRKKRRPENQTHCDVKVKPVKVGVQINITQYRTKGAHVTSRNLTLEEIMPQVSTEKTPSSVLRVLHPTVLLPLHFRSTIIMLTVGAMHIWGSMSCSVVSHLFSLRSWVIYWFHYQKVWLMSMNS